MIEIDGRRYPSEVRASAAPPPRPDQELPYGAADTGGDPSVALLESDRTAIAGTSIDTHEPGPRPSLTQDHLAFGGFVPGPLVQGTAATRETYPLSGHADDGGARTYPSFGGVRDPGSGETYDNPNAPAVVADVPVDPLEVQAARAMMEEAAGLYGGYEVVGFVRYPNDRRIMMKFREGINPDEVRSLQRTY